MPAQHIADRLAGYCVTEIGDRSGDAVAAPAGVLARHLHYYWFSTSRSILGHPGYVRCFEPANFQRPTSATSRESSPALQPAQPSPTLSPESLADVGQSGAFRI